MTTSKLVILLHPKRQTGSAKIWDGKPNKGSHFVMMVDGATNVESTMFEDMILSFLSENEQVTHLSIHAKDEEQWDWRSDPYLIGDIGEWVLLHGKLSILL